MNRKLFTLFLLVVMAIAMSGIASAQEELSLWYHGAGNSAERDTLLAMIDDFKRFTK